MKKQEFLSQYKKVFVAGTGISGISAANLISQAGLRVVIFDSNISLREEAVREKLKIGEEVEVVLGVLRPEALTDVDLTVISPGIPLDAPFLEEIRKREIPIIGEVELAYRLSQGKLAAITGTNGKTTTTALVGEIVKNYYSETFVVGNIGTPYTDAVLDMTEESVTVLEVSSFQLETIESFRPGVSAILNITPDHLDRHKTLGEYIKVKQRITANQQAGDKCVLNYDDEVLRQFGEGLSIETMYFSCSKKLDKGIYMDGSRIIYQDGEKEVLVCQTEELLLIGSHNYENVMAAVAIALMLDIPLETIQKTVKAFKAVEHRIEYVAEKMGVIYYNDSKGTNPDAAIQAIKAMSRPTLLIAGGYDKNSDYREWIKSFDGKVRYMILIGQTRDKIASTARELGFTDIIYAEDMEEAVIVCRSYANSGDAVLLSPACASWGMFENYEQRGRIFKECVNNL